jgi:hypothetical protein
MRGLAVRVVFVLLFAAANVLGPWLCCCAAPRLASIASVKALPQKSKPVCSHCKDETKPVKELPVQPCPCPAQPKMDLTAVDAKMLRPLMTILALPTERETVLVQLLLFVSSSPAVTANELPFMTTEERLYAHHVLRC